MNRKRQGFTLIEILVATFIAGVCLFPIARFVYKARWNQEAFHVFRLQGTMDSLIRVMGKRPCPHPDSILLFEPGGYRLKVTTLPQPKAACELMGEVIGPKDRILRESSAEMYP